MKSIVVYRITPDKSLLLDTPADTLDELTPQLPEGYYTTFRTYDSGQRALGLRAHLQRLYQPLLQQQITPIIDSQSLRKQLVSILKSFSEEARIRLVMTKKGEVYIALSPLKVLSPEHYQQGVRAVTSDLQRDNPRQKSTSFISNSQSERAELSRSKKFEVLLVSNGFILEGMTSNFFYVRNGVLGTARNDILLGVTRRVVLRVARGSHLDIVYRPVKRDQVPTLSEAFLTSSSRGIVPIVQIDDMAVGEGIPGPITRNLMGGYRDYVNQHAELI
jgi:branched-chain amino acid aminotransferase